MHDLILANQIIKEIQRVAKERGIGKIKSVSLEIGTNSLSHEDLAEHADEVNLDNLKFSLKSIAPKYGLDKAIFDIRKVPGNNWKILDIEV